VSDAAKMFATHTNNTNIESSTEQQIVRVYNTDTTVGATVGGRKIYCTLGQNITFRELLCIKIETVILRVCDRAAS
jgi:hypothetical protein